MLIGDSIGPFVIERELGSGAMGTVYRATFEKPNGPKKTVAIKIISFGLTSNESAMARFTRESKILEQLRHPNIVRLVGTGKYKKTPFIAMEFIDGEALDRVLERRRKLGWEEVVSYMKQLCAALQCAHDAGIIHRDLKPSNLMITRDGVLKLTDFGIAKDQDVTALTGMNSTIGTAAYMSPEQCKGDKHLTGKSDLYSLGIVMYELITGRKPFTAETSVDMFLKHVHEKPTRPSRLVPDLPVWLETLMLHLLEKTPEKRPMDAAAVGRALEEIEQKVAAQASAGMAVASARRIDRGLTDTALDDTDREAARTLRDSKPGRKKKNKKKEQGGLPAWLKFLPPVLGLVAIAVVLYFAFRPESQDKLYAKIENAPTTEKKIEFADEYVKRFGSKGGDQVEKVKTLLKETRGQQLEGILSKRFRNTTLKFNEPQEGEDEGTYRKAWKAMEHERDGDLKAAGDLWKPVSEGNVQDKFREGWNWLADKHLKEIREADNVAKKLLTDLANMELHEIEWKYNADDPNSVAMLAVRLGGLGGYTAANVNPQQVPFLTDDWRVMRAWDDLIKLTAEKPDQRGWLLLATRERRKMGKEPENPLPARRAALDKQLQKIQEEWKKIEDVKEAVVARATYRNRCRDIVELYADETDPQIQATVKNAAKFLSDMQKKK